MGIDTDKLTVGKSVFESSIKHASKRAETDEHVTSDIGILWAADRIAELEAWKQAIDDALVCCHLGTADSFESPKHALAVLEAWHYELGQSGVCEGMVLVPKEPTSTDIDAFIIAFHSPKNPGRNYRNQIKYAIAEMLQAADPE